MHTEPKDQHARFVAIMEELELTDGQVLLSTNKMPPTELAKIYSASDCT